MDVSIAVSLIRGQMGAVVERAVNGAVEMVLAEMLKVVGVKFEELKAQLVLMKREAALREKEADNIRAKLRYTELKLKYYRQGVEEELQQRASASSLLRLHPPVLRGGAGVSSSRAAAECTSPQSTSTPAVRVRCPSDVVSSDALLPARTPVDSSTVLLGPTDHSWTVALPPPAGCEDAAANAAPPPLQPPERHAALGCPSPEGSTQADSSTRPASAAQVKQEQQEEEEDEEEEDEEEEEEEICIKEEPEDEQEVMASLLLGRAAEPQAHCSLPDWPGLPAGLRSHGGAFSPAGPSGYLPHPAASLQAVVSFPPGAPPRPAMRPWTKDLSLYEEYKLRRNELRRRNLSRRRELEKTLPQPLLADLVRERREKTRLRVARWRAKRKLQACLDQVQAPGGAADLSQGGFPASSQQAAYASSSEQTSPLPPSTSFLNVSAANAALHFVPSSSPLLRGFSSAPHQHAVSSSSSSSSSFPQVSLSQQSVALMDAVGLQPHTELCSQHEASEELM